MCAGSSPAAQSPRWAGRPRQPRGGPAGLQARQASSGRSSLPRSFGRCRGTARLKAKGHFLVRDVVALVGREDQTMAPMDDETAAPALTSTAMSAALATATALEMLVRSASASLTWHGKFCTAQCRDHSQFEQLEQEQLASRHMGPGTWRGWGHTRTG